MAFYIKPPMRGDIALKTLESYSLKRLEFLLLVYECEGRLLPMQDLMKKLPLVTYSDCLIEGSSRDQISHFMLRLACCGEPLMKDFFIRSETNLFSYRLCCYTEKELLRCLKQLKKYHVELNSRKTESVFSVNEMVELLVKKNSYKELVKKFTHGCSDFIDVPFYLVPHLVSQRQVVLTKGIAKVPVSELNGLLKLVFKGFIVHGMSKAENWLPHAMMDPRIKNLIHNCKAVYNKTYVSVKKGTTGLLCADQVDMETWFFPVCMKRLHAKLRKHHRLKHHSRIVYTLFLKEIGLPVNEALEFWRQEYIKPGTDTDCDHGWTNDGRRYTYSIRHLYGLEGSRINYRGFSCSSIQDKACGSTGEGCPFKDYDSSILRSILEELSVNEADIEHIMSESIISANSACSLYLNKQLNSVKQHYRLCNPSVSQEDMNCSIHSSIDRDIGDCDAKKSDISICDKNIDSECCSNVYNCSSESGNLKSNCRTNQCYNCTRTCTGNGEQQIHFSTPANYYFSYKNFVASLLTP